jgi:peptidoglycan L-alanyl-D-glutamate endopeptidase CwlK
VEFSPRDEKILNGLYKPFASQIRHFMQYCWSRGLNIHLSQGMRTFAEEDAFYLAGKSQTKGGYSYHNYGVAVDYVFDSDPNKDGVQDPYLEPRAGAWEMVANIAARCGLTPGYFWKSFQDKPHIQATLKCKIEDLRSAFLKNSLTGLWDFLDTHEKDAFILPPSAGTMDS